MTPHGHGWLADDPDEVPLLVTPGFDGAFNLRFPEEYRDEILALLDESDLKHSTAGEFSATVDLLIESVSVVGPAALGSLAFVIRTLVHRHDKKKFVLKRGDFEVEASGYSDERVREFLEIEAHRQAELEDQRRKAAGI